ncbi:MAG: aminotransferase class V-fold PLP-dependent enzyme [Ruminococcus sp.]|nr:aminotransferase class V-fold PLP-dependent enzyme [Ruminococcus sp.]
MQKIYFDNAATSFPKAPQMSHIISNFIDNNCVNINRGTYTLSDEVSDVVLSTRIRLASFFDCADLPVKFCKRIIFTSGVTESINMFLRGLLADGDHVVTGSMEHHAVMRTLYDLKRERNISFDTALCNEKGVVTASAVESLIKPSTKAVIINHASNVFGTISPIEEIGKLCKSKGIFFAVDTAQTAGMLDISMRKCCIDFLAFSGHKGLLGLQGVGGFAISEKLSEVLKVVKTGGTGSASHFYTQPDTLPDKFESGTLNLCGIVSLNHSLKFIEEVGLAKIREHERSLRRRFVDALSVFDGVTVYCGGDIFDTTSVVSLTFKDIDNGLVSSVLSSDYGIMTRSGLHCAPSAHSSMGTYPSGTVRFSFSYFNTEDEVDYAVDAVKKILKEKYNA